MLIEYPLRSVMAGPGRGRVDIPRAVGGIEDGTVQELGSPLGVVESGNVGCWSASRYLLVWLDIPMPSGHCADPGGPARAMAK